MTDYVKVCPACMSERPQYEIICQNTLADGICCEFQLFDVGTVPAGSGTAEPPQPPYQPPIEPGRGENGAGTGETPQEDKAPPAEATPKLAADGTCAACHQPVEPDDAVCIACGSALGPLAEHPQVPERRFGDWIVVAELPPEAPEAELFLVRRAPGDAPSLLRLLSRGVEPDANIYTVVEGLDHRSIPRLMAHGRVDDRVFEVWEHVDGPTLAEVAPELLRRGEREIEEVAAALIGALTLFERRGLRHGNLQPCSIRQRRASPLTHSITDFSTASIAEFDVEAGRQRAPSRYMAPEAIASASTAGSDWWSLGIILLELLTRGGCFKDVDERAFILHVVSRGVAIPEYVSPRWRNLLEGLLTRDHAKRWKAEQALQWQAGDKLVATHYEGAGARPEGKPFTFAGQSFTSPADFALHAAHEAHWAEALGDLEHGRFATWLATFDSKAGQGENYHLVSPIGSDTRISPDQRLALALAAMNRDLPLCVKGAILSPNSLIADPKAAGSWLSAPVLSTLRKLKRDRDRWLLQLAERESRVRARAKEARLDINEDELSVLRLASSAAALNARWAKLREIFPDSANATVASLIERRSPSDEDLLLLLSIKHHHFKPLEEVLRDAETLARGRPGEPSPVPEFDRAAATALLKRPRRELIDELNSRIPGFERCQRERVDEWVDSFRSANRRMPLARLVATLAVPAEEWREPEETPYITSVLGHMHRRVLAGIQKGALVQMRAGASNLDLSVLGQGPVAALLDAVVTRNDQALTLASRTSASANFFNNVRALNNKAATFNRDTGLEALYVGYPFLTLLDRTEDGDRTRIAPLLLWPVKLSVAPGATGSISIASDLTREVTVNPALETILGLVTFEQWSDTIKTAIADGFDQRGSVLRALGDLIPGDISEAIGPVPKAAGVRSPNVPDIRPAAVLFLAEFPSQAIANDLNSLQQRPLDGTALHCLLRLGAAGTAGATGHIPQVERFETLEADPSQQEAVARSRQEPGLVVQGPPGTGKSQTIVNIITDCLGRGESVLVVCEKKAALDVVQKRLAAERLGDRVVRVENTTTDRLPFINSLKTQIPAIRNDAVNHAPATRQRRLPVAAKIDALETELDAYHEAVHCVDPRLGLSHREVLSLIASQNLKAKGLSAPALRQVLGPLTVTELESAIGACAGLVDVWLAGGIPGRPLAILKPVAVDQAQAEGIAGIMRAFFLADAARVQKLAERKSLPERHRGLDCSDNEALRSWLQAHGADLAAMPTDALRRCAAWRPYFSASGALRAEGTRIKNALAELIRSLDALTMPGPARIAHASVVQWPEADVAHLAGLLPALREAPSLLGCLKLSSVLRRRSARRILHAHGVGFERATSIAHAEAANFETSLRGHAAVLRELTAQVGDQITPIAAQHALLIAAHALAQDIDAFERFAGVMDDCPVADIWLHVTTAAGDRGEAAPLAGLIAALATAQSVADARARAAEQLQRLRPWLDAATMDRLTKSIAHDATTGLETDAIVTALPVMVPYQTFRLRYAELPAAARATFDLLAACAGDLMSDCERTSRVKIEALMRREAACAWKESIETERPLLQRLQSEIASSIGELESLDDKIRDANRRLLATVDRDKLRDAAEWATTWAGGSASKRLRQVFDIGRKLGLLHLKPVWLVNPDVASRMLPLHPGLFDVAIFDEASQMRVVNALPALFRAKRCVVSGDEKQLPPTSFFGSRADAAADDGGGDSTDADLDNQIETVEEDAEAAPRIDPRALQVAERHIKDCEDLLALSRGHLPETSLDIHYRSQYRELIAFSNAAYYGGRLNVPVSRSPAEVLAAKPIEVRRIDGLYKNQSNPAEADAIVEFLAELWAREAIPPTIGVVTFNMKQAELILGRLDARADQDRAFGRAFIRERTRKAQGEDVGFFVKNLENVQGDERDWIVFSTTFGRDEEGVFRRSFGALNQQGGERRLNVAVTRARQKVVIVTSMPTAEISDALGSGRPPVRARDYLQIYMQYAELVSSGDLDQAMKLLELFGPPDPRAALPQQDEPDELIQQALAALRAEGFDAAILPREDAFSVDIAVSDPGEARYVLGVEFDSPRHKLLARARAREIWRPKLMTRSGLRLHRISSAEWVRNPDAERARLLEAAREVLEGTARRSEVPVDGVMEGTGA